MGIIEIEGNLLETECTVIAHQVNCMGVMGSGIAKQIKERWDNVFFEYLKIIQNLDHNCLGHCLIVGVEEGKYVANLFGQYYYNGYFKDPGIYMNQEPWKRPDLQENPPRFTNYEALYRSMGELRDEMVKYKIPDIAFPYNLGACRGGGNWSIIRGMIEELWRETDIMVEIRKLN